MGIRVVRIARRVAVGILALLPATVLVPAASAGTSSTSADELSKRYDLLRESDLPTGYLLEDVGRETGRTPRFVEAVGDCNRINTEVVFLDGDEPVTLWARFGEEPLGSVRSGVGEENLYVFSSKSDAKAYFGKWRDGFEEIADCGLMVAPSGVIGTYDALDVGKAGKPRVGLTFDPRTDDQLLRMAVARSGKSVVYLDLADDGATDAQFSALLTAALERAP